MALLPGQRAVGTVWWKEKSGGVWTWLCAAEAAERGGGTTKIACRGPGGKGPRRKTPFGKSPHLLATQKSHWQALQNPQCDGPQKVMEARNGAGNALAAGR